jgi:hypothetical protein
MPGRGLPDTELVTEVTIENTPVSVSIAVRDQLERDPGNL